MKRCARSCETEDLALGLVPAHRAGALRAHIQSCAGCAAELERLQRERALFARRARAAPPMRLELNDVLDRLRPPQRGAHRGWRSWPVAAALAAAAAVVFTLQARPWLAWSLPQREPAVATSAERELRLAPAADDCVPGSCMQSSLFECEPVTCMPPVTLVAHSELAACNELPWLDEGRCGSESTQ